MVNAFICNGFFFVNTVIKFVSLLTYCINDEVYTAMAFLETFQTSGSQTAAHRLSRLS